MANRRNFRVLSDIGVEEPVYTSDLRAEVEIWPFSACAMHPARNSSFIVDLAMGQIPRSTERSCSSIRPINSRFAISNLLLYVLFHFPDRMIHE